MAMRPHCAALLLGLTLLVSTGCSSNNPSNLETTRQTPQPTTATSVTVEETGPAQDPQTTARTEPKPMPRPEIARVSKDPFVNPFTNGSRQPLVDSTTGPSSRTDPQPPGQELRSERQPAGPTASQPEIPAPDFEVRGLVDSSSGMKALVAVADRTRIVSDGQSIDGYRVTRIDNRGVTVTKSGQKFRIKMKNEFGL